MNPSTVAYDGLRRKTRCERQAFIAGVRSTTRGKWTPAKQEKAEAAARAEYPNPTFQRPRVVRSLNDMEYKIEGGQLMSRYLGSYGSASSREWKPSKMTVTFVKELLALFDEPTETVEVEV